MGTDTETLYGQYTPTWELATKERAPLVPRTSGQNQLIWPCVGVCTRQSRETRRRICRNKKCKQNSICLLLVLCMSDEKVKMAPMLSGLSQLLVEEERKRQGKKKQTKKVKSCTVQQQAQGAFPFPYFSSQWEPSLSLLSTLILCVESAPPAVGRVGWKTGQMMQ